MEKKTTSPYIQLLQLLVLTSVTLQSFSSEGNSCLRACLSTEIKCYKSLNSTSPIEKDKLKFNLHRRVNGRGT